MSGTHVSVAYLLCDASHSIAFLWKALYTVNKSHLLLMSVHLRCCHLKSRQSQLIHILGDMSCCKWQISLDLIKCGFQDPEWSRWQSWPHSSKAVGTTITDCLLRADYVLTNSRGTQDRRPKFKENVGNFYKLKYGVKRKNKEKATESWPTCTQERITGGRI